MPPPADGSDEGPPATTVVAASEDETRVIAAGLADRLGAGDIVALIGPLGAGKTVFVRGLADRLGLAPGERVSSPSYTLVNDYLLAEPVRGAERLVHLDLYRLAGDDALEALGFAELDDSAIVVIEWPEHAPDALAAATVRVQIGEARERGTDARVVTIDRLKRPAAPPGAPARR